MKIGKRKVAMLFVLTLLTTSLVFVQVALGQDVAYIDPPEIYTSVCQDFTVTVIADVTYRIDMFEFLLIFDPTQMSVVDAYVIPPWDPIVINIGPGFVEVVGVNGLLGPGPVALAEITFHCDAPGTSELWFDYIVVEDEFGGMNSLPWKGSFVTQFSEFYWKASYRDYAPSGIPDFDERQDLWVNPITGKWSWCGPVAVANSLWWMDSRFETSTTPPPTINDTFPLVQAYGPWDDHDVQNVGPFVSDLAWLMDTDGQRTGIPHNGTNVFDMQAGIAQYFIKKGVNPRGDANGDGITSGADAILVANAFGSFPGHPRWDLRADLIADNLVDGHDIGEVSAGFGQAGLFYEKTVKMPSFEYIEWEIERCEDVILLLGCWENQDGIWKRVGGHFVTCAGVDSPARQIAWSDPIADRAEALGMGPPFVPVPHAFPHAPTVHNDTLFVSHDPYQTGPSPSPGGIWGPEEYYTEELYHLLGENFPPEFEEDAAEYQGGPISFEVEYAVIVSPTGEWYWKHNLTDYAPSGIPDFDQKQDAFNNPWGPNPGSWSWCGPTAVANSLWWLDSDKETSTTPPPTINDTYPLVVPFGPWDDHDPSNVVPLISYLGWLMDTDGSMTGIDHCGTDVYAMEAGIRMYLEEAGLERKYTEETVVMPEFEYIEAEFERCEDVVLLLGFWQQDPVTGEWWRIGGHFVTVAGVDSEGYRIAFSDPYRDHAEQGYPGIVIPPEDHGHTGPPEDIHNNATFVSHDIYNVAPSPSPGGIWGIPDYIVNVEEEFELLWNFVSSNFPEELWPYYRDYIMIDQPVYTEIEYAVIVSPVCPPGVVAAGSEDTNVYVYDIPGNPLWQWATGAPVLSVALDNDANYLASGSRHLPDGPGVLSFFDVNAVTGGGLNPPLWVRDIPISESYDGGWAGTESKSVDVKYNFYNGCDVVAAATDWGLYLFDQWGNLIWQYMDEMPETIVRISQDGNYIVCADYNTGEVHYFSHLRDGVPGWGSGDGIPLWTFGGGMYDMWAFWIAISGLGDYVAVSVYPNPVWVDPMTAGVVLLNRTGGIVWFWILNKGGYVRVDMPCDGRSVVSVNDDPLQIVGCDLNYFSDMADGISGWSALDGAPVWSFWPGYPSPQDWNHDFYTVAISENGDVIATGGADGVSNVYVLWSNGTLLNIVGDGTTVQSVDLTFTGQYGIIGSSDGGFGVFDKNLGLIWGPVMTGGPIHSVAISKIYPCMFPFPDHDLAVINVTHLKTVVCQGLCMFIDATVENQGDFTENNIQVTVYANNTAIQTLTIASLASGAQTTLTFIWNASGFAKGKYTISAKVNLVQNEIEVYDNTYVDGTVTVACKGDLTGPFKVPDGTVDMRDISLVARGFGANHVTNPASPRFCQYWHPTPCITCPHSPNCDLTGPTRGVPDGKINMMDISLVARLFGTGGC